jgi:hypothetical protein
MLSSDTVAGRSLYPRSVAGRIVGRCLDPVSRRFFLYTDEVGGSSPSRLGLFLGVWLVMWLVQVSCAMYTAAIGAVLLASSGGSLAVGTTSKAELNGGAVERMRSAPARAVVTA